jgi:hypothetical protein
MVSLNMNGLSVEANATPDTPAMGAALGQFGNLKSPGEARFGKAMEQHDWCAFSCFQEMLANAVRVNRCRLACRSRSHRLGTI